MSVAFRSGARHTAHSETRHIAHRQLERESVGHTLGRSSRALAASPIREPRLIAETRATLAALYPDADPTRHAPPVPVP